MGNRILKGLVPTALLLLVGCGDDGASEARTAELAEIREAGELVVLTRNAPTTYYIDRDGRPAGPEYDLVAAFAEHLGVELRLEVRHEIGTILEDLSAGRADLAAAGLTATEGRQARFRTGPSYQQVQQQVICRRGGDIPSDIAELPDVALKVIGDSSYVERLQELKADRVPGLDWEVGRDLSTELVLEQVWERRVDCTVADSNIFAINRRYYPELLRAFPITEQEPLAWLMPSDAAGLESAVDEWMAQYEAAGGLARMQSRYYGHVEIFDYVDTARYVRRIDRRLPRFRRFFHQAAEAEGLDWHLLAAQSYQESHWDPAARSPTGVRGLMMLTQPTAREVGVENRLDPRQSIRGGARYLADLRQRLPDSVTGRDRTWLALAAYNVGMGHLYDARRLAERLDRDPDRWTSMREVLPLLTQPRYYRDLRYGYARGNEPVHYVRRIRNYVDILERQLEG
ncbi:membrane-bound lytic murein transglycosylase F [Thiohalospira halophila DSM 15071]|uniref:Membrane-bound lytic murein transglycosylase F n=1 Tax=Thiohalospira halophila DSM 15071 TaxID=1123397 RepID=A0A1I1W4Z5_9GAMM|nr:membrane-bound lytic murein transglycosylase MltF [Thiohalospira halophila]SFD88403.1 membrane-bound lytic murein transglycosylase F [Thiohalospira halophila DSM 15071]